eukprot:403355007
MEFVSQSIYISRSKLDKIKEFKLGKCNIDGLEDEFSGDEVEGSEIGPELHTNLNHLVQQQNNEGSFLASEDLKFKQNQEEEIKQSIEESTISLQLQKRGRKKYDPFEKFRGLLDQESQAKAMDRIQKHDQYLIEKQNKMLNTNQRQNLLNMPYQQILSAVGQNYPQPYQNNQLLQLQQRLGIARPMAGINMQQNPGTQQNNFLLSEEKGIRGLPQQDTKIDQQKMIKPQAQLIQKSQKRSSSQAHSRLQDLPQSIKQTDKKANDIKQVILHKNEDKKLLQKQLISQNLNSIHNPSLKEVLQQTNGMSREERTNILKEHFKNLGYSQMESYQKLKTGLIEIVQRDMLNDKYKWEVGTNVAKIAFKAIYEDQESLYGQPVTCSQCQVILNLFSKFETDVNEPTKSIWNCELCGTTNKFESLNEYSIPNHQNNRYFIKKNEKIQLPQKKMKPTDISVVYCLDVSGSMRKQAIPKDLKDQIENRNITILQCLQEAILGSLKDMSQNRDWKKVGVVTFSDGIQILGDGSDPLAPKLNNLAFLENYDEILNNALEQVRSLMSTPIRASLQNITNLIQNLKPTKGTALGPALLSSVVLAGEGLRGSQVVVCTNGMPNTGLGSFQQINEQGIAESKRFYQNVGNYAKEKGVTVHLISIKGKECNIESIAPVAEISGGKIERVDPLQMKQNFIEILQKDTLASTVKVTIILHPAFEILNENPKYLNASSSQLKKEFGAVYHDTEFTFQFRLKEFSKMDQLTFNSFINLNKVPFQLQIQFVGQDGDTDLQVFTYQLDIQSNRQNLEQIANFDILAIHAINQTSKLARSGKYKYALVNAKAWHKFFIKHLENDDQKQALKSFEENITDIYKMIYKQNYLAEIYKQMGIQKKDLKVFTKDKMIDLRHALMKDKMSQQLYAKQNINTQQFNPKKYNKSN